GGGGRHRGGLGQDILMENESESPIALNFMAERTRFAAPGFAGGNPGGLGDLLLTMEAKNPGSVPADLIAAIHTDNQQAFLNMDLSTGQLGDELNTVINNPAFAQIQIDIARAKVAACANIAKDLGLNSIGGVMLVTDMVNQMGQLSAERVALNAAKNYSTEAEKINGILQALHSASPGYSKYYDSYVKWVNHMNDEQWFNYAFPQ
ncbi:MAG: hydantoinase B/oxoprolinase family protein, partial [Candidatus Melainabacteria bacterium]|nr:hydantoinase B/oxoprolinase family protein [Candidatus Melainabacteria bacterium]